MQTYGWLNLLARVVTAPLRPFGLDRGRAAAAAERRSELRAALRWYREQRPAGASS